MSLPPLDTLNRLAREQFAEALRPLFEAAPPLADALFGARPFTAYAALIEAAESLAQVMPFDQQAAVLNAHPRIGADPANVSPASFREQGYAGEAGMDRAQLEAVYAELADLNRAYEQHFGFRFVVFVDGRPKAAILDVLRERLHHSRDEELQTGLRDMFCIARARLAST